MPFSTPATSSSSDVSCAPGSSETFGIRGNATLRHESALRQPYDFLRPMSGARSRVVCQSTKTPSFTKYHRCAGTPSRSEEHTSELQSRVDLVCRLLLE